MKQSFSFLLGIFIFLSFFSCKKDDKTNTSPQIIEHPHDLSAILNDTSTSKVLSVLAKDDENDLLTYQWYYIKKEHETSGEGTPISDAVFSTYRPNFSTLDTTAYFVVVSDSYYQTASNSAKVSVVGAN